MKTPAVRDPKKEVDNPLLRFLPTTRAEMEAHGWDSLDILLVTGDAYVDHPSFGIPLLGRWLEHHGYRVGILAQPRFDSPADFLRMGEPRLFVGISSGTVDSMLNNYTANRRSRSDDSYSPGGKGGRRPDYASVVYAKLARLAFPNTVVVGGGVETSLRRLAHYDYWQNKVRPSLLVDAPFDAIVFGMGERSVLDLADALKRLPRDSALSVIQGLRGVASVMPKESARCLENRLTLPSFEEVRDDKKKFAKAALFTEREANPLNGKKLVQYHGSVAVVINEPPLPLPQAELDSVYALPFTKEPHFSYTEPIPAFEMIRFSVTACRGCIGGCSFCAITLHQGRIVQSRSRDSVVAEVAKLTTLPGFTGHVTDVGGPTANCWNVRCKSEFVQSKCRKMSCLHPKPCPHLVADHGSQMEMLRRCREIPKVKSIRIASGIRYDLAFADKKNGERYLREVVAHHVGGQLKVAPEHLDPEVLHLMRKPLADDFERFQRLFVSASRDCGKEQYIVPYFISGFPGCTHEKMGTVHDYLKSRGWNLQQVQAFIPTPMTMATAMYWTGLDPVTREPIFVAKSHSDRKIQQALLQPSRAKNGPRGKGQWRPR